MDLYLWIKALHVVAVIAWMAALLYLPRLFVYHAVEPVGSATSETFKVMERRLLKAIATPAMIVAWLAGLFLIWRGGWLSQDHVGWLHGKLLFVVLLSGVHGMLARFTRDFANDRNAKSQKFYRMLNEVPTLLMLAIVALVIVKPF